MFTTKMEDELTSLSLETEKQKIYEEAKIEAQMKNAELHTEVIIPNLNTILSLITE